MELEKSRWIPRGRQAFAGARPRPKESWANALTANAQYPAASQARSTPVRSPARPIGRMPGWVGVTGMGERPSPGPRDRPRDRPRDSPETGPETGPETAPEIGPRDRSQQAGPKTADPKGQPPRKPPTAS